MDSETNDLVARQYMHEENYGSVEPREFADWAVSKLENGHDTKSLRMLASEFEARSFTWEVESHFRESIGELGWEFPDKTSATRQYAESIMQKIVSGNTQPYDGCRELHSVSMYLDYPEELSNWTSLFWAEDFSDEELNTLIRDEACRTLAGETTGRIHERIHDARGPGAMRSFWIWLTGHFN